MSSGWHLVLIKCRREPRIVPIFLGLLRIAICFIPQTGYLHPDEFFQSSDITAGRYFESKVQNVWEFTSSKPIRCMLIPSLLNSLAFKVATLIQRNPSAYLLIVAPRLAYTLLSFVVDAGLYKLCQYYSSRGLWYLPISIVFQSSFVCLGCLTRTLSNVPEVVIFSMLLVVVCHSIRPRFRILFVTPTRSTPAHEQVRRSTQLKSSIMMGFLITLGTFNRPTFPSFALIPLIYWLLESFRRNSHNIQLNLRRVLLPATLAAALTFVLITTYDTVYYTRNFRIVQDLLNLLIEFKLIQAYAHVCANWIVTPYNFITYNTNVDNLAKYGLHKPYIHMLVNIPLAFNLLGLLFYRKLFNLTSGSGAQRLLFSTHRVYALMLLSTLTSTILLSFIPHQEFRFLLPLIVPLAYTFAFEIYSSNKLLSLWLAINLALLYFYSSVHQAGVIRATLDLDPTLKSLSLSDANDRRHLVDVLAFRCYLVPSYAWNIRREDERFNFDLQDTIESFPESLDRRLAPIANRRLERSGQTHKLFVMLPRLYLGHLRDKLEELFVHNITNLRVIKYYNLHFNGEDLGESLNYIKDYGLSKWQEAMGFSLIEADLINEQQPPPSDDNHLKRSKQVGRKRESKET